MPLFCFNAIMYTAFIFIAEERNLLMIQKIIVVSHCFFNDAVKLKHQDMEAMAAERAAKRTFLLHALSEEYEMIQLPCPEFLLYGSHRWGHAVSQFDTPHFRMEARRMLEPIVMQLEEYAAYPDRYEILGIVGIDGSPSCGVDYTYDGDWGGEFGNGDTLPAMLKSLRRVNKPGIFMRILKEMLHEKHLSVGFYSIDAFMAGL